MNNLNNNVRNKAKVTAAPALTAATIFMLGFFIAAASVGTGTGVAPVYGQVRDNSITDPSSDPVRETKAPMAASEDGNNVYVVWWTNRSGNWEVMFRASNDGGQTFGDKINLSNSTDAESQTAEILAVGDNTVFVSWWETSAETGSSESVLRVSTDGGQTFGPMMMLGMNGTISTAANTTGAAEGGEGGEEE
jgi:hypothetical protein